MDENGVTRIAKGERKENYKRENQKSWRMTMSKLLRSKVFAMMMMLIVLIGGSSKVSAAVWESVDATLMEREAPDSTSDGNIYYMIGAKNANKKNYTADLVSKIIFTDTAPTSSIYWDVSFENGTNKIVSYLVSDSSKPGYYIQYIVCSGTIYTPTDASYMFSGYTNMNSIENLTKLNTYNSTNMSSMFYNCSSLTSVDLSGFTTSKVVLMDGLFRGCKALTAIDASKFNTTKVTDMSYMFDGCTNLRSVNISSFNTGKVTTMNAMFQECSSLSSISLSNFDTSKVENMGGMFNYCSSLTNLDVSNFNTENAIQMLSMFNGCSGLKVLDLRNFKTSNLQRADLMFMNCSSLETLLLGENFEPINNILIYENFDTSNFSSLQGTTGTLNMFLNTPELKRIILQRNVNSTSDLKLIATDNKLSSANNAVLYVPSVECEALYESADTTLGDTRIETLIKPNGEKITTVPLGSTYTDAGASVAGGITNAEMQSFGYTLETTSTVTTSTPGEKTVTYTLKYKGETVATETRTVNVVQVPNLMERDTKSTSAIYMLGAQRANKTTYKSNLVDRIIFSTTIPEGYIVDAVWDLSKNNGDYTVVSYLKNSTTRTGYYDQYIVANSEIAAPRDSTYLFYNYTNMRSIENLQQLNTSNVISMTLMFSMCSALESIDLSGFDTSNVTTVNNMFLQCKSLTELDVSSFNTTNFANISGMFQSCENLEEIIFGNFDTSNVTDISFLFCGCNKLKTFDISKFKTDKVTNMRYMFEYCESITNLDLSHFNTAEVINMKAMFKDATGIKTLNVNNFNTTKVTDMESMFYNITALQSLDLTSFNTQNVTEMRWMFYGCSGLTSLNLGSNFDTSKITSTYSMFNGCSALTSLNLGSKFNTENVSEMSYMFKNCSSLTSLNISMFDWSNVTKFDSMFDGCIFQTNLQQMVKDLKECLEVVQH